MKSYLNALLFTSFLFLIAGCSSIKLQGGKYTGKERGEFAMVYEDLIFLRVKAGKNIPGSLSYWEWGGKYSIREDGIIELDMDRETARDWRFYYDLRKQDNGIRVIDHRAETSFRLEHIPAVPPQQRSNAPASYPAFQ